ncbi:HpcH/HpaI aldolase family protein [Leucobacter massiliensis]|uniref:4-hydroxy-2-oxovalerate aldolase n=1 Tax=Leucobacter massiliensis TaxID=1686285 RepID=A0A2S9QNT1_9MICO|nr:aldolase/citrate lyase family protein [Leucobacter massiliensis]PRI11251.1 4-hydroxy-2-oxovalerate aldolase [Leucobacter massiliensis]
MSEQLKQGAWLSDGSVAIGEIVAGLGYDFVVLDVEHGAFDLAILERFIPVLKGLGLEVLSKVLVPERGAIQQVLDFGSDGVIIPHIEGVEHAKRVTDFAKFPPLGSRSLAGGRTMGYAGYDDAWVAEQDRTIKVFPMVEDPRALRDVEQIAALDTVDGIFIGPGDLSLMSGRGVYRQSEADFEDFRRVVAAARANDKPWILPAWTTIEKEFAVAEGADYVLLAMQHAAISEGYRSARALMDGLIEGAVRV